MASCRRAGATCAGGRSRASTVSMRAWIPPIQAWKSLSTIFIGRGSGERFEHFSFEHLDLLLRRLQLLLAVARQLEPALVRGERLLERQLAAFHARDDFFQLSQRLLEIQLCFCAGFRAHTSSLIGFAKILFS